MRYQYRIAGISIIVDAPIEVTDTEAFALYREPVAEDGETERDSCPVTTAMRENNQSTHYEIHLIADEYMPKVTGTLVFENEMNRVYQVNDRCLHLFHIIFTTGVAAWNWIEPKNELQLHYAPAASAYFKNSFGIFNAAGFERILFQFGKFLFHCAYVDYKGHGVLFSAPSGGGKTTQGLLWEQYAGAEMINGDRAVLEKTKDGYLCHGLPIAGSSGVFTNRSLPLSIIFRVQKSDVNRVSVLTDEEAFQAVFSELTINLWNDRFKLAAVEFAMRLCQEIPVYRLECRMDEGAVDTALRELKFSKKKR